MEKMENLRLQYIIIGSLYGRQRSWLELNLQTDKAKEQGVQIICETEDLKRFSAKQSMFISGDYQELQRAIDCGMATLGYLSAKKCTQVQNTYQNGKAAEEFVREAYEYAQEAVCPNTDMWAEGFEEIGLEFLVHVYERHHGLPWTILVTKRCVVKEFSMDYLDALFELYAGEGMTDYIEPLYPYEKEREYQEAYIKNMYGFYGYGMWIVCDKTTGKLIGRAGLEHREELAGEMELGYAIGVPYQRQGYAAEVCRAILRYADKELNQTSICCLIEEGNLVSENFAKKLGFVFEQMLVIDTRALKKYVYYF